MDIIYEPYFSQRSSFCRILMSHKNVRFTPIPDKTNDMIFLKCSKTLFLGHFWPFSVIFDCWEFKKKKNSSVTHNYIWAPNTMLSFRKKLSQFKENLWTDRRRNGWKDEWIEERTDRRMDRWKDRLTDLILWDPSGHG